VRRDDESVRTTRKVHNCPVYGWDSRQIEAWLNELPARIVDALEQAAFRGEWSYDPELTALEAAIATADIIVAALHHG
jgi:hypothetical protein